MKSLRAFLADVARAAAIWCGIADSRDARLIRLVEKRAPYWLYDFAAWRGEAEDIPNLAEMLARIGVDE